jgi:glycine dehydrogenase subunit 2
MKFLKDISHKGKAGCLPASSDVPKPPVSDYPPDRMLRKGDIGLPGVSEPELMRYFVNLSTKNHHLDKGFYPLGSCTMKYNPKINDVTSSMPGFTELHPLMPDDLVQGALEIFYDLSNYLSSISGMSATSLQPSAGAHGEFTGIMVVREYLKDLGETQRTKVLIPDSAHGTNPASIAFAGWEPVVLPRMKEEWFPLTS